MEGAEVTKLFKYPDLTYIIPTSYPPVAISYISI
jgi:hypothetical protein